MEGGRALELPREGVESPCLEKSQTHLDAFLCHLLWVTLLWQGGSPEIPSHPNHSGILPTQTIPRTASESLFPHRQKRGRGAAENIQR